MKKRLLKISLIILFVIWISYSNNSSVVKAQQVDILRIHRTEIVRLSGSVFDENGIGIPNQVIYFYDQSENKLIGKNITDITGYCYILWQVPANHSLGIDIINVTYNGNNSLYLGSSFYIIKLLIVATPKLLIDFRNSENISTNKFLPSDTLNIYVKIKDEFENPFYNANISVNIDDLFIITKYIKNNYSFNISYDLNTISEGIHKICFLLENSEYNDMVNVTRYIYVYKLNFNVIGSFQYVFHDHVSNNITFQIFSNNSFLSDVKLNLISQSGLLLSSYISNATGHISFNISKYVKCGQNIFYVYIYYTPDFNIINKTLDVSLFSHVYVTNLNISESIILNKTELSFNLSDAINRTVNIIPIEILLDSSKLIYSGWYYEDFSIDFIVVSYAGTHNISIIVNDYNYYIKSIQNYSFIVYDYPYCNINLYGVEGYLSYNQRLHLSLNISLFTYNSSYLKLKIYENLTRTFKVFSCGDEIEYIYKVPNDKSYKLLLLNISFENNSLYPIKIYYFILKFKIRDMIPTKIDLISLKNNNNFINILLRLKSLNGSYLKFYSVCLLYNYKNYINNTDTNGYVGFSIPINEKNNTLFIYFYGDRVYMGSNATYIINLISNNLNMNNYQFILSFIIILPFILISLFYNNIKVEIIDES